MTIESTHRRPIAVLLAITYIAVMGLGMWLMHHRFGISYGEPNR